MDFFLQNVNELLSLLFCKFVNIKGHRCVLKCILKIVFLHIVTYLAKKQ